MTRIVKAPDVRKSEIINTAQRLFYQKGYSSTSVNEIIKNAGIAKGTFYHYYSSKTDIIDEIISKYIAQIEDDVLLITEDLNLSPIEKLNEFFLSAGFFKSSNRVVTSILVKLFFLPQNVLLKEKMINYYVSSLTPILVGIVSLIQSWENEPESKKNYTAELILLCYFKLSEELANMLLDSRLEDAERELITGKSAAFSDATEKILGLGSNNIQLLNNELIGKYFEIFSKL